MVSKRRFGVYGGTFDPVHRAHLEIARRLVDLFEFDLLLFVPAFRAPHKQRASVAPAIDRYAMLALATADDEKLRISRIELDEPGRPYTIDTLVRLKDTLGAEVEMFFVMGSDSWNAIVSWYAWEELLGTTNHVVVTRPGHNPGMDHVNDEVRKRIIDIRGMTSVPYRRDETVARSTNIYFTDIVLMDDSATSVRGAIAAAGTAELDKLVPASVAEYIRKYGLYTNGNR